MAHATTFEELDVYKTARALSLRIYEITRDFPKEEKYSLTDQIRRSSRSIGAQIAEAWAKRKYPNHFISKLTDADGEQHETRHWVLCALDLRLLTDDVANELLEQCKIIGRRLQTMIDKSSSFCK